MTFRTLGNRRFVVLLVAAVAAIVAFSAGIASGAGPASPGQGRGPETYTIGLFGDMPYGALGRSQYPNLLADINQSRVAFSIFAATCRPAVTARATTASTRPRLRISTRSTGL
jgi:hypothetical protein